MVGTDGSSNALVAAQWAARAAAFRNVDVTVAHVVGNHADDTVGATWSWPTGRAPDEVRELAERDTGGVLARSVAAAEESGEGVHEIRAVLCHGRPVAALAELSRSAQLVAVGGHGVTGRHRRGLGPVSRGVIQHAHCPVAVVREEPSHPSPHHRPVLVGVDGSRASNLAAVIAFDEAAWRGVDLLAMHVCHDSEAPPAGGKRDPLLVEAAEAILTKSLSALRTQHPAVRVHHLVRFWNPVRQLLRQGERAQLIVLGSHGRGSVSGALLGSVSAAVAEHARAPVIVARHR
ncbi:MULTISPECIES: universal stress protein [Mycobacteriaceae]|uniref:Universal stress protein n=1 Tax=Mycolicibacterium parafortuitum TaxID=39692 RepID=A0ACC6MHF3_MYCPF|nr:MULTISPECIES: universal stress protein [Mycobacteriaceae]MDZ5086414.1 universal stress protein [Mycolicibacterium parafortuitum]GFM17197.1 UspA domain protein [Mycobacterium sp. PO1]GFM23490.1 UspA domain protein [Mycobacterium sp. PO2]